MYLLLLKSFMEELKLAQPYPVIDIGIDHNLMIIITVHEKIKKPLTSKQKLILNSLGSIERSKQIQKFK